jgi:hypothetical protein
MTWRIFAAAAIGKSHIDAGTPCQDAFAGRTTGDTLIACVCDGAGSQSLSHEGSRFLSEEVVRLLAERVTAGEALVMTDETSLTKIILETVGNVRAGLEAKAIASGAELANYAATLVGVIATPEQGYFFHVGDGVGAVSLRDEAVPEVVSQPENGEYANETYFVSGVDWSEHLRITPFASPAREIALMSDGAAPFVMAKGNTGLYRPFMDPVVRFLESASEEDGNRALAATLEDPRTYQITGDDKTLLIALWR